MFFCLARARITDKGITAPTNYSSSEIFIFFRWTHLLPYPALSGISLKQATGMKAISKNGILLQYTWNESKIVEEPIITYKATIQLVLPIFGPVHFPPKIGYFLTFLPK